MFKNAKTFNEEGSEVYNDAVTLQKFFDKYGEDEGGARRVRWGGEGSCQWRAT